MLVHYLTWVEDHYNRGADPKTLVAKGTPGGVPLSSSAAGSSAAPRPRKKQSVVTVNCATCGSDNTTKKGSNSWAQRVTCLEERCKAVHSNRIEPEARVPEI
jgi:hypothetical protein